VVPPLLYAAAVEASLFDIRANLRSVVSLSVLLVVVATDRLRSLGESDEDETLTVVRGRLRREMIDAEREEIIRWRDAGRLPDRGLRVLQQELDHEEGILPPPSTWSP